MTINQQQIEFFMLIISIFGAFYRLTKIENGIKTNISSVAQMIELHKKEHELIEYRMQDTEKKLNDHHQVLKNNGLLRREKE